MAWRNMMGSTTAQIETEAFSFGFENRQRPRRVRALIRLTGNTNRTSNLAPLALKGVEDDARIYNTEAGHLVGLSIGGPDCSDNLVPMHGVVNRDSYRAVERFLESYSNLMGNAGVHIEIHYADWTIGPYFDPRLPISFEVKWVHGVTAVTSIDPRNASGQTIFNRRGASVCFDVQGGDIARRWALKEIRERTVREGWHIEQLNGPAVHWSQQGWLPPIANRPYGFVDRLMYDPEFAGIARMLLPRWDQVDVGPGKEFSEGQRMNIVYANCYTQREDRKGQCWSDDPTDPVRTALTAMGSDDGIQIDHIVPKTVRMGPNIYSNAQILSSAANRRKSG